MTQEEAFDMLKLGHNVYLTGSAGSGKTFLLNKYIHYLRSKGVFAAKTASTGIAATHMNGMTIHSWSGMGIKDKLDQKAMNDILANRRLISRFEEARVLIIDEVSMIHSRQLDLVDQICKAFKKSLKPFGGLQIVLCGDFFQLPPVSRGGNPAHFIHKSNIWQDMDVKVCYLQTQHRQEDKNLVTILNDIRANNTGEHTLIPLRKTYKQKVAFHSPTKLYTHNVDVDSVNQAELDAIPDELHEYEMSGRGKGNLVETLKNSCLAPEFLQLKKGAVVMFVKNDQEGRFVNGTLGTVADFTEEEEWPVIKTRKESIVARPEVWRIEENGEAKAEIRQIPLRLAWAITVHKSQGMTLDAAEIDLSKSFVEGMGYVALSRVRALSGLRLMGLNKLALKVNEEILALDKELIKMSQATQSELQKMQAHEKSAKQKEFINSIAPKEEKVFFNSFLSSKTKARILKKKNKKEPTRLITKKLIRQKLGIQEIAIIRGLAEKTIIGHLEDIIKKGEDVDLTHIKKTIPQARFKKIKKAFLESEDENMFLTPAKEILGDDFSYEELRLVRLFIK